jgi:hypothetical protein
MKRAALAGVVSSVMLGGCLAGLSADNPYQDIVNRNAFALNPIPPPPPPTPPQAQNPTDVFLSGISTIGGVKKAFLRVVDKTPGRKEEFPILIEGEGQGRVDVVSINVDKGEVVIKIDGNEKTITFEKEAPKGPAAPPGVLLPPGHPGGTVLIPSAALPNPAAMAGGSPAAGYTKYGNVTVGGAAPAATSPMANLTTTPSAAAAYSAQSSIPSRPMRGDVYVGGAGGVATPTATAPVTPGMTREQAILHIEEQRKMREEALRLGLIRENQMPPLPPSPLSQPAKPSTTP